MKWCETGESRHPRAAPRNRLPMHKKKLPEGSLGRRWGSNPRSSVRATMHTHPCRLRSTSAPGGGHDDEATCPIGRLATKDRSRWRERCSAVLCLERRGSDVQDSSTGRSGRALARHRRADKDTYAWTPPVQMRSAPSEGGLEPSARRREKCPAVAERSAFEGRGT